MQTKLISTTLPLIETIEQDTALRFTYPAEQFIAYCARVSSNNQENPEYKELFKYLITHGHWSPFEMVDMTIEIITSRAIAPQILRHRSFSFQEFSQRYAAVTNFEEIELRIQGDSKQGSGERHPDFVLTGSAMEYVDAGERLYNEFIEQGVSRETARMILPLCTQTKIYMKGSVRSWIHYLQVRLKENTQKEHRLIANEIKDIFCEQFPITAAALSNFSQGG